LGEEPLVGQVGPPGKGHVALDRATAALDLLVEGVPLEVQGGLDGGLGISGDHVEADRQALGVDQQIGTHLKRLLAILEGGPGLEVVDLLVVHQLHVADPGHLGADPLAVPQDGVDALLADGPGQFGVEEGHLAGHPGGVVLHLDRRRLDVAALPQGDMAGAHVARFVGGGVEGGPTLFRPQPDLDPVVGQEVAGLEDQSSDAPGRQACRSSQGDQQQGPALGIGHPALQGVAGRGERNAAFEVAGHIAVQASRSLEGTLGLPGQFHRLGGQGDEVALDARTWSQVGLDVLWDLTLQRVGGLTGDVQGNRADHHAPPHEPLADLSREVLSVAGHLVVGELSAAQAQIDVGFQRGQLLGFREEDVRGGHLVGPQVQAGGLVGALGDVGPGAAEDQAPTHLADLQGLHVGVQDPDPGQQGAFQVGHGVDPGRHLAAVPVPGLGDRRVDHDLTTAPQDRVIGGDHSPLGGGPDQQPVVFREGVDVAP